MKLGAIADDFTGATDLANTLVKKGMRVVQMLGVPEGTPPDVDAVVVALKSRSIPARDAVTDSLAALDWLKRAGARQILFKYCSTFDSTAEGNIGPVSDALQDTMGTDFSLICPAFPTTGRTIYQGHLFVQDQLLSDSPLKDHPLNPMHDASLIRLMEAQSAHRVGLIPWPVVQSGPKAIRAAIADLRAAGLRYGVIDAIRDEDLRVIGKATADHSLITGGSGIALGLPANHGISPSGDTNYPDIKGRPLVLAGSCSAATRAQIDAVGDDWTVARIDVDQIANGTDVVTRLVETAKSAIGPVLIYASADPDEVAATQAKYGREAAGAMVEKTMASLATTLTKDGFTRLIVAGGETSGAVVSALGLTALHIHGEIDPGVPWTSSLDGSLALALKSGNFGGVDFFDKAFGMLP